MKVILAALAGMAAMLCVFAGGVGFAIAYLSADPVPVVRPQQDTAMMLPTDPVRVDPARQDLERIDTRQVAFETDPGPTTPEADVAEEPSLAIDETTTASIPKEPRPAPIALNEDHVAWCFDHYRSYRPETNSYTPYSGGSRKCVSPYGAAAVTIDDEPLEVSMDDMARTTADGGYVGGMSARHIQSCFDRYRSYRPEDNSYQPYGGGPRRQCE